MIIANVLPSSVSGFDYSSLMTELFKQTARANLVHVSYKGGMAATTAIMADEVQVYFDSIGSAKSRIDAGCIRVLAETRACYEPVANKETVLLSMRQAKAT